MSHKPDFDLAIVGGGIGGLCLALAVIKFTPISVTVYEDAPKFGEIGAGVAFGPNAVRALSQISEELFAAVQKRANFNMWPEKKDVWFDYRIGMDGKDEAARSRGIKAGTFVKSIEQPKPGSILINRSHLLDELVKLLPENIARFGKTLVDIQDENDEGVLLSFADGTTSRHSAVIGCDGIKSRTRRVVLGQDHPAAHPVFTGKYCYRALLPMEKAVEALGEEKAKNCQAYLGYHGHLLTFPVANGTMMNVVAFNSTAEWPHEKMVISTTKEEMIQKYSAWGDDVRGIMPLIARSDIWALFDHPPADTYYKNRICLLGDAAHASTPFQGAGAGMAVEDAYVLARILQAAHRAEQLPAAFRAYDEARRERTQKQVATSRTSSHLWHFETEGFDDVEKLRSLLRTHMDWIWNKDLDEDVAVALAKLGAAS